MPAIDGARLRAIRERKLMTQAELAARIGAARTTITRIELGRHAPQVSTVRKLAQALGVDPAELFPET
jgi:transcriptional regulator with XRE-family HTH domain